MKKIFSFLFLLSISLVFYPQNTHIVPSKTFSRLDINSLECKINLMNIGLKNDYANEYGSGLDMTEYLIPYISILSKKSLSYGFLSKNQESIKNILHNLGVGKTDDFIFLKTKSDFPVSILEYKNNSNMLLLTNILSPITYNSIKLNSRERARDVISNTIIELVEIISQYDFTPLVKYVGCGICYRIDDFSNRKLVGVNPEFVFAIFPINALKLFRGGNITEDKLIQKSDVYISEYGNNNLKKIDIKTN